MLGVLTLFLIPVGGGIPAGVLLAQKRGFGWPVMEFLYLVSDVILAFSFEPILRGLAVLARRSPFLTKLGEAFRLSMEQAAARYGKNTGPFALILIAFGVDPMTGRAAALAAGHGFVAGWAIAIAGDMIYFTVVMLVTLKLKSVFGDPEGVVAVVLLTMFLLPVLVRKLRAKIAPSQLDGR